MSNSKIKNWWLCKDLNQKDYVALNYASINLGKFQVYVTVKTKFLLYRYNILYHRHYQLIHFYITGETLRFRLDKTCAEYETTLLCDNSDYRMRELKWICPNYYDTDPDRYADLVKNQPGRYAYCCSCYSTDRLVKTTCCAILVLFYLLVMNYSLQYRDVF